MHWQLKLEPCGDYVIRCIRHPNPQVKLAAMQLVSVYLADFTGQGKNKASGDALEGSHGLTLDVNVASDLVRQTLGALSRSEDEALASEASQILIFLAPSVETDCNIR